MILFWVLSTALLLVAMLFVALPLWRKSSSSNDVLRDAANLGILRDQSAELETDLHDGLLTQEAYEQGKRELQVRLMEEVKTIDQPVKPPRDPARVLAIALVVLLPLITIPIYLVLGNQDALISQEPIPTDAEGIIQSDEGLKKMENRLKRVPKDPN
ncbi:MAG: c-type cytochrome biogenesis protein CcmI, partial [Gallionella sp.]